MIYREIDSDIYFCNSPTELSVLDRKDLPKEKWDLVRKLQRIRPVHNWMVLFFVVLWGISGFVVMASDQIVIRAPGYFLIACAIVGLPILMHESCHSLLFKHPFWNRWLGFICGLPGLVSVSAYKSIHLAHHAFTRSEKDPDNIELSGGKSVPLVIVYYAVLLVGILIYIPTVAVTGFRRGNAKMRAQIVTEYLIMSCVYSCAFLILPSEILLQCWIYPLFFAMQISNVRGLAEHGLTTGGNEFTQTRTVLSNTFVSFMMCNLNYHLEHHLFPGVPWYNLPALHHALQEEYRKAGSSVYRSYTQFLIDFFKTTWHGIVPNVRLIPAHLRDELCA